MTGATAAAYTLPPSKLADAGRYRCQATNDWVTGLTLYSIDYLLKITRALPPDNPDPNLNRNWSYSRTYDLDGNITSEGKQFVDALGRPTQAQSKNLAEKQVFASQTIINRGGVSVLTTLPAPTNNQSFNYKAGFVTAITTPAGGGTPVSADYSAINFEKPTGSAPDPLEETTLGTLGYYYSPNNTLEPAIAAAHNPFSLSEPLPGPLGGVRRQAGPGDAFALGSGHEVRGRDFPLLNELDHYSKLRAKFVAGSLTPSLRARGVKVVAISPNGIESVSFANREGQAVAACLTGDQYPVSTLTGSLNFDPANPAGNPVYQDIHIPASAQLTSVTLTDAAPAGGSPSRFVVLDLSQNPLVETAYTGPQTLRLAPGFYRLQATAGTVSFSYPVHYGNFSYVFYDDAGRSIASIAPKGMDGLLGNGLNNATVAVPQFVTTKTFDTSGRVLSATSPDEGTSRYVYARDGRIRFSQSALQAAGTPRRFSYSNYDAAGRVIESGEYSQSATAGQGFVFENMLTATPASNSVLQAALLEERVTPTTPNGRLAAAQCAQRNQVWYDRPQPDAALGSRQQDFVLGAVAKTSKGSNTTWYSYDDRGQLTWLVQQAPGVGVKTVDYSYDAAGNVTQVAYQSNQPDAFYHYYTYDANQRLTQVTTSPDGVSRTLQASYVYYLHGPLKRVETAGNLQGTDYTYTVQGWLKSINGANRRLDGDSPQANGFTKDLFGLTLDYFSGDYRSAQPGLATPTIANAPATRYDGLVRSAAWFTTASPDMRQHVFTYDEKGQLKQADFGQLLPGSTPAAAGTFVVSPTHAYEEGNLSYDRNGNILTLRRRDGNGVATDDFTYYNYPYNSNKLTAVSKPGGAVLDYDYDALGQMTRQRDEQGQRYLSYDVTGKVTGVYRDAARQQPLVAFSYDDKGFRTSKASYDPATFQLKKTTYSVRDIAGNELATYALDATVAGSVIQRSEVPLYGATRLGTLTRLDDGSLDYRYELNDQLGNARVIYHRPATTTYLATMEPGAASQEEKDFTGVAPTRYGRSGHNGSSSVARLGLTNGLKVGPGKVLSVQKGDTITFRAYAWLTAALAQPGGPHQPLAVRVAPLVGAAAVGTGGAPASALTGPGEKAPSSSTANLLTRLSAGVGFTFGAQAATPPATPQTITGASNNAYLHFIIKDAQGTIVRDDYQEANGSSPANWQALQVGLRLAQAGTVQLSVETDGASGPDVYFDDVQVDQTASPIVQEQHSYAYGAPMLGLNYVVGTRKYRHGYQGQYAERDEETGTEDFELRNYDSRIGRWTAPDPAGQFSSPYVGMGNNPVSSVDPDGGFIISPFGAMAIGAGVGAIAGGVYSKSNGGDFWSGAAAGAAVGAIAGGFASGGVSHEINLGGIGSAVSAVETAGPQIGLSGAQTWYYVFQHDDTKHGLMNQGHAQLFNPYKMELYEKNHPDADPNKPDGLSSWLHGGPKSRRYVWDLTSMDAANGIKAFWGFRGNGARGTFRLYPVTVLDPAAATRFFEYNIGGEIEYNLKNNNCKHYILNGLQPNGGQSPSRSILRLKGPKPKNWVNSPQAGTWNTIDDVGKIPTL